MAGERICAVGGLPDVTEVRAWRARRHQTCPPRCSRTASSQVRLAGPVLAQTGLAEFQSSASSAWSKKAIWCQNSRRVFGSDKCRGPGSAAPSCRPPLIPICHRCSLRSRASATRSTASITRETLRRGDVTNPWKTFSRKSSSRAQVMPIQLVAERLGPSSPRWNAATSSECSDTQYHNGRFSRLPTARPAAAPLERRERLGGQVRTAALERGAAGPRPRA